MTSHSPTVGEKHATTGRSMSGNGGHTPGLVKWVVGAFLSGLLTSVAFLLATDRARIDGRAEAAYQLATENHTAIAVLATVLERIEHNQGRILERLTSD